MASKRFLKFIASHDAASPMMPAVHITNAGLFDEIVQAKALDVRTCKFYKEPLLYFFYGKPTYQLSRKNKSATRLIGDAAICFVLDLKYFPAPHRSFALDTGAFFGERYDDHLPNGVGISDFEVEGGYDALARLVTAFFKDNRHYYAGRGRNDIAPSPLDRASEVYTSITRSQASRDFDERACSFEIQVNTSIPLDPGRILTVVMPDQLFDDQEVKDILQEWGVKPILYRLKMAHPEERTAVIYDRLADFYETAGIL